MDGMTGTARRVECEVAAVTQVVEFVHGLGGPIVLTAYDVEGREVGWLADVPITDNEVEVVIVPGTVARLVAELAPDPASPTAGGTPRPV